MRYGSVCSGIEAASVAWRPLGWKCAFVSEIEKFPAAVLAERFPEVPNLGDFTKIERGELRRGHRPSRRRHTMSGVFNRRFEERT